MEGSDDDSFVALDIDPDIPQEEPVFPSRTALRRGKLPETPRESQSRPSSLVAPSHFHKPPLRRSSHYEANRSSDYAETPDNSFLAAHFSTLTTQNRPPDDAAGRITYADALGPKQDQTKEWLETTASPMSEPPMEPADESPYDDLLGGMFFSDENDD